MPLAAILVVISVTVACARGKEAGTDEQPDEQVLVALSQAKNHHHLADVHLADGDSQAAIDAVTKILGIPFPQGSPEGQDALFDARARHGKLYLGMGRLEEARRVVDEGLAAPPRESFFLANLWTVSGEIHETRAQLLDDTDAAAAKQARRDAIQAFSRSIEIAERIQKRIHSEVTP
jgi:hypothetical protein